MDRRVDVADVADFTGVRYAQFNDPDGNLWLLQQFPPEFRQPGQSFYN